MRFIDSHCHLDLIASIPGQDTIMDMLSFAREKRVCYCLNVCVNLDHAPRVLEIAKTYPGVGATIGLHPNECFVSSDVAIPFDLEARLFRLAQDNLVLAIGETGLDYFREGVSRIEQQTRFRTHIRVAKQLKKPLIVHTRVAPVDTLTILREEHAEDIGGIMHCFTEDLATAQQAIEMNFYISLSGIVTFRNVPAMQMLAKEIPINRLLIETDAPYLAPHPYRGKTNVPAYVVHTAEAIALLRDIPLSTFAEQTTKNFLTLFPEAQLNHV